MTDDAPLRAGRLMSRALRDLLRPPFRTLLLLSLFLYVVSAAIPGVDLSDVVLSLIVAIASVYVQIAVTLAAASPEAGASGDLWFRAALARRCFWRAVGVQIVTVLALAGGLLLLVVGAFVVGGMVALGEAAVVLERARPLEAIRRSAALGRPARRALSVVFTLLVFAPSLASQAAFAVGLPGAAIIAVGLPCAALALSGSIALARAYVALGGRPGPVADQIRAAARSPS